MGFHMSVAANQPVFALFHDAWINSEDRAGLYQTQRDSRIDRYRP